MTALRHDDYDPIPPDALDDLAREILREAPPHNVLPHRTGPMGGDLPSFLRAYDAPPPPLARRRRGMPLAGKISLAVLGIALAGVGSYAAFVEISHSSALNTLMSRLSAPASRQVDLGTPSSTTAAAQPDSLSRVAIAFAEARDVPAVAPSREAAPPASPQTEPAAQAPRQDQSFALASIAPTATTSTPAPAPAQPAPTPSRAPEVPVAALGPATVPAPTTPPVRSVAPTRSPQSTRLVTRARSLITETGDIAGARLLLEKAAELGDPDAAFLLAETHDHSVLMRWRVVGPRGDAALARRYYEQALSGGIEDARARLSQLGN